MPRWRADGKELYYFAPDQKLMATAVAVQVRRSRRGRPRHCFRRTSR
jgi:hypothetical protein